MMEKISGEMLTSRRRTNGSGVELTSLVPGPLKLLCYFWPWDRRQRVKEREADRPQVQEVLTRSAPAFSFPPGPSQDLFCHCGHREELSSAYPFPPFLLTLL